MAVDPYIGIQMNQKELTKTIMVISNWRKHFALHGLHEKFSIIFKG